VTGLATVGADASADYRLLISTENDDDLSLGAEGLSLLFALFSAVFFSRK